MRFASPPLPGRAAASLLALAAALGTLLGPTGAHAQGTGANPPSSRGTPAETAHSSTGSSAASTFFGPLTTEEAGPLARVGYTHVTEGADLLPAGRMRTDVWMGYANIFEQDSADTHDLFLDLERLGTTVAVRWGATDRLEVGGRLGFETTGGGFLDAFVSGWHNKLGLGNGNREKYPFGVYALRLRDGDRDVRLDVAPRTMALEDVRLFAKWRAWRSTDGRRVLSVRGVARLPASESLIGSRRADFAVMALGRASSAEWIFHGTVGGSTLRAARDFDGLLRGGTFFADAAFERPLAPWVSGVLQLSFSSPTLRGFEDPELDGWPVNVVFGLTGKVRDGWLVDVSFQEDIPPNSPAVDFTLGIGVRRSW